MRFVPQHCLSLVVAKSEEQGHKLSLHAVNLHLWWSYIGDKLKQMRLRFKKRVKLLPLWTTFYFQALIKVTQRLLEILQIYK